MTLPETGAATVNLINGSGKPVSVAITAHPRRTGYRSAPCLMAWRHTVCGALPAVTAPSPVPLCLRPGKHGRHLCHHGGAARTGKEAIVDNGARFEPQSGTLNSVIPPAVQHLTVEVSS